MASGQEETYREAQELSSLKAPALRGDEFAFDPDIDELNNPDVEQLSEPPLIGSRPRPSDLFGEEAENFGRATSPKLYAQASQFPTAVQYRVWRWENGVPVALGAIDSEATEEDFVRQFFEAMPKRGEGKFQYRLRPIDIRGKELGKEFTINISEHHATVRSIMERRKYEREEGYGRRGGDVIVHSGDNEAGSSYAEEMGRMFESAVDSAEQRTAALQQTLEMERDRLREEEKRRAEERVATAERSATVVQSMTEKLMETDRLRSDEAMKVQKEHSGVMMNTLTTVFQQQQEASRQQSERMRQEDDRRRAQDREFFERQRMDAEAQRQRDRDQHAREREEREAQRRHEMEQMKLDAERRKQEENLRLERERERVREERDRWRQELEEKRQAEQREWQRRQEEADRRRQQERQDWERREALRREEMSREQDRRREEMLLQTKGMELSAQRDREHSERMMEMSRLERETQREAQAAREKMEREAREIQDRERQRAHDMAVREMEMAKERDREHQERMMKLSTAGMGGLKDMLGMETPELLAKIFGGGEEGSGWSDAIPKVLGSLAEMGKVALNAQAEQAAAGGVPQIAAPQEKQVAIQTPEGVKMVPMSVLRQAQKEMAENRGSLPPIATAAGTIPLPDFPMRPPGQDEPIILDAEAQEVPTEANEMTSFEQAQKVKYLARAKKHGMSLADQKKARKAARKLVGKAKTAPKEEWQDITTAIVMETFEVYEYIKCVTVYAALAEAGAEEELANEIVEALKESGMIPSEVPYTEEDYARIYAEESQDES